MRLSFRTSLVGALVVSMGAAFAVPALASSNKPSAPRAVHAVGGAASATVKWAAPTSTGGAPITKYVVVSTPAGKSCTSKKTSCRVTGLKNKTTYRFTVEAFNRHGAGVRSAYTNKVTPKAVPVPTRSLSVTPSTGLTNGQSVKVSGSGFTPHDSVFVLECLANATGQSGCDIQGIPTPITITASGTLPVTTFKVVTGHIGSGTCGTTAANASACAISVGNVSGGDTAGKVITFKS